VRILIAPDKFAGTLSAPEASAAIARGWRRTAPDDVIVEIPLADGGPGFLDVLRACLGGELLTLTVTGPTGAPVEAAVLMATGADDVPTAYLESAQACGLHLTEPADRDPRVTTSRGVGELLVAAIEAGARRVVVGLGGSGTNDAGAGMLAALGARAVDSGGADVSELLSLGGAGLRGIAHVDLEAARARVGGGGDLDGGAGISSGPGLTGGSGALEIIIATDVDNPLLGLRGATNGFGPQKGADQASVMVLEGSLEAFVSAVGRRPDGKEPAVALGAGAAGGLGYAFLHLGATRVPGIATVLEIVSLARRVGECDLVITGEGAFDWQSLRGKVVAGVAEAALSQGRPCLVLAGRSELGRREFAASGVSAAFSVVDHLSQQGHPSEDAFEDPAGKLADLAERAARTWSR